MSIARIPARKNCSVSATSFRAEWWPAGTSLEPVQSRGLESAPDGRAPAVSDPESTRRGNYEHLRLQPAAREVRDMSAGPSRRSRGSHSPRHGPENAGKTTRLTCSVTLSALSRMARSSGTDSSTSSPRAGRDLLRFARDSDVGVLRFDENRSSCFLDRLPKSIREACVPTAPECRLLRNCLQPKPLAKFRMAFEVLVECCFVLPSVEFLQDE